MESVIILQPRNGAGYDITYREFQALLTIPAVETTLSFCRMVCAFLIRQIHFSMFL